MDCQSCKEARYVPLITHETDMKILAKCNARLFTAFIVAVVLLLTSWMFFFWYREQYTCEKTEIRIERHLEESLQNQ